MKGATKFWLFLVGLSAVLLLGHLFADYAELRGGVIRFLLLLAVIIAAAGGVNVAMVAHSGAEQQQLISSVRGNVYLVGGVLAVLLLIVMIGGF